MFERDKNELRDLGIPLETGRVSSFDPTEGYRINRDAYALPAVELTAEEAAAVAVATQLWESPELITATQGALLKLRAAGVDVDRRTPASRSPPPPLPGLRGSEDVLGILLSAIDSGQAVQFPHRPSPHRAVHRRAPSSRGVWSPHRGRWYLVGHDRDRDATRTFRLSRIGADVKAVGPRERSPAPTGSTCATSCDKAVGDAPTGVTARVWVADGRATALRRAGHVDGSADRRRPRRRRDRPRHGHAATGWPARSPATAPTPWSLEPAVAARDVVARLQRRRREASA